METVRAVFEDGVFRPVVPVQLAEHIEYDFEPRQVTRSAEQHKTTTGIECSDEGLRKVYEILDRRYSSGYTDTAARHNEHQP